MVLQVKTRKRHHIAPVDYKLFFYFLLLFKTIVVQFH